MSDLWNAKELRQRLALPSSTFFKYQGLGYFRMFETTRPIGTRRYSRALVEHFLSGRSIVRFGAGARRAS